jgi:hypothetical protein
MRLALACLTLLGTSVAFAKTPVPQATGPGSLVITCQTEGAEVFVDGEKKGTVPLPGPIVLTPGEHTIKVQKAGFAPLIDVFKIAKRGQTKLDVELVPVSGALKINANVEKARVFVDGKFMCEAPCSSEMGVGARAVQVSKGGYKDFFQNVEAVAGQELVLDVKMEELPPELNPYKPPPPPPAKWYEKWWVWTAAVGGAAVVATAVGVGVWQGTLDRVADFGADQSFTVTVKERPMAITIPLP